MVVVPVSAERSALNVKVKSFVEPALTAFGKTRILPPPTGTGAPATLPASAANSAASAIANTPVVDLINPSARLREAEVKQTPGVAVGVVCVENDSDQAAVAAVGGGNQAVGCQGRPAGLDAVGAAVGRQQVVLVDVDLAVGRRGPAHAGDPRRDDRAETRVAQRVASQCREVPGAGVVPLVDHAAD